MVQTRAQERSAGQGSKSSQTETKPRTTNRSKTTSKKEVEELDFREEQMDDVSADDTKAEKRKRDNAEKEEEREQEQKSNKEQQPNGVDTEEPPNKAPKTSESEKDDEPINSIDESAAAKVHKIIEEFGALPLKDAGVAEPLQATPETILAMVLDAMLKSTRISHSLAQKAVNTVIEAGYHDIKKLSQTTWDDRVDVLAKGGYNRYREQASTNFGALIEFVNGKYGLYLLALYHSIERILT